MSHDTALVENSTNVARVDQSALIDSLLIVSYEKRTFCNTQRNIILPKRSEASPCFTVAEVRWLKVHYLGLVIPWMSCAKLFSTLWLIGLAGPHFSTLCFSVPSHHLLLKTNFQYLSGSPIKDLHCDSIFHFNYYTWCKRRRISLFIKRQRGWTEFIK